MPKITVERVTLPAHWAPALINGDYTGYTYGETKDIEIWQGENPHLYIVGRSDYPELTFFNGVMCECLEYDAHVTFTALEGNGLEYLIYPAYLHTMPLPHHTEGLSFTATGYGSRIPTDKCIYLRGRRYRIYCRIFSNIGTCFINFEGRPVVVRD